MIDNFALGLTHALMLVAAWRLLRRPDLDRPDLEQGHGERERGYRRRPRA